MVGNLSAITQDGPGWFTRPFQDRGDTQTWEYHAYFTQLASSYVSFANFRNFWASYIPYVENMETLATALGVGYLVHEDEAQEMTCKGWLRFKRTYAGVPNTRYEACEVPYSFPIVNTVVGVGTTSYEVQEWPMTLEGYRKYEYYVSSYPEVLQAAAANVIFNVLYLKGDYNRANTPGVAYLAQDSKISIYKGAFAERMSLYYIAPTLTPALPTS